MPELVTSLQAALAGLFSDVVPSVNLTQSANYKRKRLRRSTRTKTAQDTASTRQGQLYLFE